MVCLDCSPLVSRTSRQKKAGGLKLRQLAVFLLMLVPLLVQAQLGNTSWPKYRANSLNTGVGLGSGGTNTVKWSANVDFSVSSDSMTIASDGTLYVGSQDGNLYAIDGKTGAVNW